MAYTEQTWHDTPATDTPISAARLTHIEDGLFTAAAVADAASVKTANLADLASAATARTNLGLGSAATHPATDFGTVSALNLVKGNGVVFVEDYGAAGDGVTDDSAAIRAAIAAAISAAQSSGSNYAEVRFQAKVYAINGSLQQGGATKGNALIPMPVIPLATSKVTLAMVGAGDASALLTFTESGSVRAGTVLKTTVSGTNDGTFGEASVIGGPTAPQGYGAVANLFTNLFVKIDGMSIIVPNDPNICGVDMRGVGEFSIGTLSVQAAAGYSTITYPTQVWTFGVAMPEGGNNAVCDVWSLSCWGFAHGWRFSEHTAAHSVKMIRCIVGHVGGKQNGLNNAHNAWLGYALAEGCTVGMRFLDNLQVWVEDFDYETAGGAWNPTFVISDSTNLSTGRVNINRANTNLLRPADVDGCANLNIIDMNLRPGAAPGGLVPAVGASTVAVQSPFYKDAAVHVAGGTVTAIAVDGQALGVTSGLVIVPPGKTITLTYSVAPTWKWTLL